MGENWFKSDIVLKVGNGEGTRFGRDCWIENSNVCILFHRLFSLAVNKEEEV